MGGLLNGGSWNGGPNQGAGGAGWGGAPQLWNQYQGSTDPAARAAMVGQMQGSDSGASWNSAMRNSGYALSGGPDGYNYTAAPWQTGGPWGGGSPNGKMGGGGAPTPSGKMGGGGGTPKMGGGAPTGAPMSPGMSMPSASAPLMGPFQGNAASPTGGYAQYVQELQRRMQAAATAPAGAPQAAAPMARRTDARGFPV